MKNFFITIFNKIKRQDYKQYFKTNVLFISTVGSLLLSSTLLRFFTVKNFFEIKPIIADLAIVLLIASFAYLFKPKKQIYYLLSVSILFTAICIINSIYYTFYSSFASVSLLATSLQIVDVGDAVVENVMQLKDFVFIIQPIFILFVHFKLSKGNYYHFVQRIEKGKKMLANTLIAAGIIFALFFLSLTSLELGRLVKQWNREFLVMKFGIYTYQVNDIIRSLEPKISSVFGYDKAAKNIKDYYANNAKETVTNKYTNIYKDKNLLFIHAESIQQFLIGFEFNGVEVTPNLNKLSREGLYFSNFYSQVSVGTSSDTEFTLNTSLLPVSSGTVFISYWNQDYVTIPKLLKEQGYYSFSMHGNNGAFWNRLAMHKKMGYDNFYAKTSYNIDDTIGLGLSDKSFFKQSVPMIKEISEAHDKFYGTMIMLSNHTPFSDTDKYGEFAVDMKINKTNEDGTIEEVSAPYMEGTTLGNYIKSVHYADAAIGEFIQELDTAGLLENTVIVIYGDHDARLSKKDYVRLYNYDPYTDTVLNKEDPNYVAVDYYKYELNRKVPFIIWTKDNQKAKEVTTVMGMYDILPTIGNMVGIKSEYQLGNDMFSVNDNIVMFPNGNWLTNKIYYNSQKQEYLLLEDSIVSQEYIDTNTKLTEDTIQVSNDLIIYDYIGKSKETTELIEKYSK
ncbi:MAG: LTA synthase family protein [Bacilli bacterium]|nr:LTA synthase family protein [Bacilli bacterium]